MVEDNGEVPKEALRQTQHSLFLLSTKLVVFPEISLASFLLGPLNVSPVLFG
jgi:hypothetical protein